MTIRLATYKDIQAIAKVHVDTWGTTYRNIVSNHYLDNLSYKQKAKVWQYIFDCAAEDGNFTYVAEDKGGIVGFANGGLERTSDPVYKGELNAIYILQNYQGKGLGRYLVRAVVERLHAQGINSMMVWVLADNPACKFYAALGGKPIYKQEIEIGEQFLTEVAYGWEDTKTLRSTI